MEGKKKKTENESCPWNVLEEKEKNEEEKGKNEGDRDKDNMCGGKKKTQCMDEMRAKKGEIT